jgi:hypothetical protein
VPGERRPETRRKKGVVLARGRHDSRESRDGVIEALDDDQSSEQDAVYRDIVLKHEYLFDRDFPEEYKKAKGLIHKFNNEISDDDFRFRLGEIVYLHRKRHAPDYKTRIDKAINNAELASDLIEGIWEDILKSDHLYRDIVLTFAKCLASTKTIGRASELLTGQRGEELELLQIAGGIVHLFRIALTLGKNNIRGDPSSTRPKTPYTFEASKLLDLWLFYTKEEAVYPKRVTNEEISKQPSTEFVRLGIKMIDSNSTLAKVHTSIIRAKEKKEKDKKELERFGKDGLPSELVELIRRLHE